MRPNKSPEHKREVLIDLDGFFRHAAEAHSFSMKDVMEALPHTQDAVRKVLVLHSLIRSSLVLAGSQDPLEERKIQDNWSEAALLQAIVESHRGSFLSSPDWLTFYADDLRKEFAAEFDQMTDAVVQLTLDNRLFAWAVPKDKIIRLSAITREYLLRMNVFLVNASDWIDDETAPLDEDFAETSLHYFMSYIVRLHRRASPTNIPTVRPNTLRNFHYAQIITQIQVEFLLTHEFGHLLLKFPDGESFTSQEEACDTFAFERIVATEPDVSKWFMAVRWLFDILALDRVVGEILAFEEGDWNKDIDWIQDTLRERQRTIKVVTEHHGTANSPLSRRGEIGTLLLLDAKWRLNHQGPEATRSFLNKIIKDAPELSVEDFRSRVKSIIQSRI